MLDVIFDLDGVLLDTEPLNAQADDELTGEYGGDVRTIMTRLLGRTGRESARIVIETFNIPLTVDEYMRRRHARLFELYPTVRIMPGVEALVRRFHAAGVRMAIATSSPRELLTAKIRAHPEFFALFDGHMVCADDVTNGKPDPEVFLKAAKTINADPTNCIVFEDAPAGAQGAKAAGMLCVAFRSHLLKVKDYRDAGADVILESWLDFDSATLSLDLPSLGKVDATKN